MAPGSFFTLLGPSGSGKSTLLRIVAGLEAADSGRVLIAGRDVGAVPPWKRNLGMVFQQYAVFPHMSVAANVAYGLRVRGRRRPEREARVAALLELVGLAALGARNAALLSGGEQQRVALARALAPEPAILLLDEPLSALDEKIRREMQGELKRLQRSTGTTFLYVTHDQEEALAMSDRIAVLNGGRVVQMGTPEAIFRRPESRFVAEFFRGCNVLSAQVEGTAGEALRLRLAGQAFVLPGGRGLGGRERVNLAVRAERLTLGAAAEAAPLRLTARLEETSYRGSGSDHRLRLDDGQTLLASSAEGEAVVPGAVLRVGLDPGDCVLLPD